MGGQYQTLSLSLARSSTLSCALSFHPSFFIPLSLHLSPSLYPSLSIPLSLYPSITHAQVRADGNIPRGEGPWGASVARALSLSLDRPNTLFLALALFMPLSLYLSISLSLSLDPSLSLSLAHTRALSRRYALMATFRAEKALGGPGSHASNLDLTIRQVCLPYPGQAWFRMSNIVRKPQLVEGFGCWGMGMRRAISHASNLDLTIRQVSGEREFFIDNRLVRIHFIIEMILADRPFATGG